MHLAEVDIIDLGDFMECTALRACLENWSVKVNLYGIGQPNHLVALLDGQEKRSGFIILCGHGDERGIHLEELGESLRAGQAFNKYLGSAEVEAHLKFNNSLVLSTACMSGTDAMADAFLSRGVEQYLGPGDYPEGSSALYFAISFCYQYLVRGRSVRDSYEIARSTDEETGMFRLFE
ncbi:hypothetical protein [Lewinella sp. 4G2]|uniref:hypothetical protein n=1 Tax=Lewinella sp. 4G2 TaxID=1803372 RepID=UPI0007B4BB03|nr:hypothetical protein [Lewinella sp. 4G2]OAV42838.1 hypothetical protein A3850_016545 [Lewinella sp. 4G2]